MPSTVPCVIVHADGFGSHPAVNEGIERGCRYGVVTSAAVQAVGDALEDAVRRSRALPSLDLGLHFVLQGGDGRSLSLRQVVLAWGRGDLGGRETAGRLRGQLDLLLRVHRVSLSHIVLDPCLDTFPPLVRVVAAVAMEYQIPAIRLRNEVPRPLRALSRLARRQAVTYGRRTPDCTTDLQGCLTPLELLGRLRQAQAGITEIVCRPAVENRVLRAVLREPGDWERDLEAVCDPAVRFCAQQGQVALVTWRDL